MTRITRVRLALADDMPTIFSFGYDQWSEGRSIAEHTAHCQASTKYQKGTWYLLESDEKAVSALICYRDAFNLRHGIIGIGSVATAPEQRLKGYASHLIRGVMTQFAADPTVDGYFLFSDVDPVVYEKLGFVRLAQKHQRYPESVAMICPKILGLDALVGASFQAPSYF